MSRNDATIVSWPRGSMLFHVSLMLAKLGMCEAGGSAGWRDLQRGVRRWLDLHPHEFLVRIDSLVANLNRQLHLEVRLLDVGDDGGHVGGLSGGQRDRVGGGRVLRVVQARD